MHSIFSHIEIFRYVAWTGKSHGVRQFLERPLPSTTVSAIDPSPFDEHTSVAYLAINPVQYRVARFSPRSDLVVCFARWKCFLAGFDTDNSLAAINKGSIFSIRYLFSVYGSIMSETWVYHILVSIDGSEVFLRS